MAATAGRGFLRRAASLFLKVFLGLVLFLVLGLIGALIWLRSDSAAHFLEDSIQGLLREQGFILVMEEVSGPLPGHLHIRNLRFSDDNGLLFKADALSLDARLSALFRGRLEVERILVDAPELLRLPALPPSESPPEESGGGVPVLPIDIVLDKLEIRQAAIHTAALSGGPSGIQTPAGQAPDADKPQFPELLHIELSASAALRGASLEAAAQASIKDEAQQGIDLDLQLASSMESLLGLQAAGNSPAQASGDNLSLSLQAGERSGGPIALLAGVPDMPGYRLTLKGAGPVSDWRGYMSLLLDPQQSPPASQGEAASGHLLQYTAQLRLRCATGSFWRDIVTRPGFSFGLESRLAPGDRAPAPLLPVLGEALHVDAQIQGAGKEYSLTATVKSPALELNVPNLSLRPRTGEDPRRTKGNGAPVDNGTVLSAAIQAKALDLNALAALGNMTAPPEAKSPAPALPLDALSLQADLSGLLAAGYSGLEVDGALALTAQGETFSTEYALSAVLDGDAVILRQLRLQGLGLLLEASARANAKRQDIQAKANLTAADHADWQHLAARLAGFADPANGAAPLGGALRLDAALDLPPLPETITAQGVPPTVQPATRPPATGSLILDASDMRWPTPELAGMLGQSISLRAKLSGGDGVPYSLELADTRAGIFSASGQAVFTPGEGSPVAGLPAGTLDSAFTAKVSDLSPLAGKDSGVAGALEAKITAAGPLNALAAAVEVTGPSIRLPAGLLRDVSLKADAKTALLDALFSADGAVNLSLGQSPGGPLSLNTRWQASLPTGTEQGKPLSAALRNFQLQGAGLNVRADLTATVSGAQQTAPVPSGGASPPPLALNGSLKASVQDWQKLAALSGAPLSGSPASIDVTLANASGKQAAKLSANLPLVRLREPGQERSTFFLREVTASFSGSDLFGSPGLDLSLQTGMGLAGPLFWNTGSGSIKGGSGKGAFSLALRQENKRGPKAGDPKRTERLTVQGSYDLAKPEVALQTLALRHPQSGAGLLLKRPMTVSLENGVAVKNAAIDFLPSGSLAADASFTPESLAVKLKLDRLPFAFFKLFTPATLPDGELHAKADFSTTAQGPRGAFSVYTRISATQSVSGAALPESYANGGNSDSQASAGPSGVVRSGAAAASSSSIFEFLLNGDLSASPGQAAVAGSGVRALPGVIWLRGNGTLGASGTAESAKEGRIAFQLPLRAGANGTPAPDAAAPFAAMLSWKGSVAPLWQAVPMPDRYLTGQALLDIKASGTLNNIRHDVSAYLAGCRFQDVLNGILISGIDLEAKSTSASAVRAVIAANDGLSGSLAMEADLTGLDGASPSLKMRGQLDKFRPLHRDDLSISLSGILGLNGPLSALQVTSDIVVDQGEVLLSSKLGGSVTTLEVERKKRDDERSAEESNLQEQEAPVSAAAGPALNMRIRVPQYFYIRGMGLDSEWQGDLRITGSASSPSLVGALSPVRGYLDIFSRTFALSGGNIEFSGGSINPALNLELTYEGPDVTAFIRTGGTAKKPKLSLDSRPPLPQDEILAHVLFGKRTSELSRFEAIQLANSLRELTGVGGSGLDMLGGIRKTTGLDMLRVGGGQSGSQRTTSGQSGEGNLTGNGSNGSAAEAGAPTLEAGKYINESIYVGVEQGATTDSTAVRVEVELFPSITLQGKSSSEASEVGIGWKKDY